MGEWKRVKLGEIADLCLGKMLDAKKNKGELRPYLNNVAVRWGGFDLNDLPEMRFEESEFERYSTRRNDIIACEGGEPGRCAIWESDEPIFLQKALHRIRIHDGCNPRFVYYQFCHLVKSGATQHLETGSTIRHLPGQAIREVELQLPDLPTQRRIAAVLGALDDKIEVNRKICENLEAQAQAMFKAWFVDFEPFGGKRPEGWKLGKLGDVVEGMMNGDWGKDSPDEKNGNPVFCIRGADIPDVIRGRKGKMPLRYILPKNFAAKQLAHGNIVVEISGGSPTQSTGRSALITDSLLSRYERGMVCTNFCKAIRPKIGYSYFFYFWWRYLYDQDVFFQYENGTTGIKNLDISTVLAERQVEIPPADILMKFSGLIEAHISAISQRGEETETLAAMRDALLPKLMSGELAVEKVEVADACATRAGQGTAKGEKME